MTEATWNGQERRARGRNERACAAIYEGWAERQPATAGWLAQSARRRLLGIPTLEDFPVATELAENREELLRAIVENGTGDALDQAEWLDEAPPNAHTTNTETKAPREE